jgi:Tol biopolymer transport system component
MARSGDSPEPVGVAIFSLAVLNIDKPGIGRFVRSLASFAVLAVLAACGDEQLAAPATPTLHPFVDRIAFAKDGALFVIGVDGAELTKVAEVGQLPNWSPKGDLIAFLSGPPALAEGRATGAPLLDLHVVSPNGSGRIDLTNGATGPGGILGFTWSPDGERLAFAAGGNIYVVKKDGSSLSRLNKEALGDLGSPATAGHSISWAPDGSKIAFTNGVLHVIDSQGNVERVGNTCGEAVAWSPDSKRLAVACGRGSVSVVDPVNIVVTELANGIDMFDRLQSFAWSPDSSRLAFDSQRPRPVWVVSANGATLQSLPQGRTPSWSPDGTRIAFACPTEGWQVCTMNADGTDVKQVTDSAGGTIDALSISWSPARP